MNFNKTKLVNYSSIRKWVLWNKQGFYMLEPGKVIVAKHNLFQEGSLTHTIILDHALSKM